MTVSGKRAGSTWKRPSAWMSSWVRVWGAPPLASRVWSIQTRAVTISPFG